MMEALKDAFDRSFKIAKFQILPEFERAILELGSVELVSAEFGERSHIDTQWAVYFTNRRTSQDRLHQVGQIMNLHLHM